MINISDLDDCALDVTALYGGHAGRKEGIVIDGATWLVKYPERTEDFESADSRSLPSYTTSPLSEFIGSRVYQSLGIPVHQTLLGTRRGKLVVACRDFTQGGHIRDFASIKNSVSEDELVGGNSSNSYGEPLRNALEVIESAPALSAMREETRDRFWDMFVIDALILNNDRNNENWGLLVRDGLVSLAPVFDNGQSFFNKKGASTMRRQNLHAKEIAGDVSNSFSFFTAASADGAREEHIRPFEYLSSTEEDGALGALERFAARADLDRMVSIIEDMPVAHEGIEVMSEEANLFYRTALSISWGKLAGAAGAHGIEFSWNRRLLDRFEERVAAAGTTRFASFDEARPVLADLREDVRSRACLSEAERGRLLGDVSGLSGKLHAELPAHGPGPGDDRGHRHVARDHGPR